MRSTFWITLFLAAIFLPGFASLAMADESFSLKKTLKAALYFDPEPKALSRLPSEFMPVHAAQKTADQLAEEADLQESLALQKELAERPFAEIYYTVSLNSEKMSGLYLILKDRHQDFLIMVSDLQAWGVIVPESIKRFNDKGADYVSIRGFTGASAEVNDQKLEISLDIPAAYFPKMRLDFNPNLISLTPSDPGAYFNYDLVSHYRPEELHQAGALGLFDLGFFNKLGSGHNSFISSSESKHPSTLRLITQWRMDTPATMHSLNLGDSITQASAWSGAANFGGIQWGTDFLLQPGYLTFPQPAIRGQANLPTALDLYVDGSLRRRQQLATGAYDLSGVPFINGSGELKVVTRDILGREQTVLLPFYMDSTLLKKGLKKESYELGFLRKNLGLRSFDYDRFIVAATQRRGLSDHLTGEVHTELLSNQASAGLAATYILFDWGTVNASFAESLRYKETRSGQTFLLSFGRQVSQINLGFNAQVSSPEFRQSGMDEGVRAPRSSFRSFVGLPFKKGSLAIAYLYFDPRISEDLPSGNHPHWLHRPISSVSINYSKPFFSMCNLMATATINLKARRDSRFTLSLNMLLDTQTNLTASTLQGQHNEQELNLQRSLLNGPGFGYQVRALHAKESRGEATLSMNTRIGSYSGQIAQSGNHKTQYSGTASGSVAWLDGRPYLARYIFSSFAVVDTSGLPNIPISIFNQVSGHTDSRGFLLIPELQAYQKTDITIDPLALPLNAELKNSAVSVAPYYRSGLRVHFDLKLLRSATITVKQGTGQAVPEGATLRLKGHAEEFLVAEDGVTYLTNIDDNNTAEVSWGAQHCQFFFRAPKPNSKDPIPNLGEQLCRE